MLAAATLGSIAGAIALPSAADYGSAHSKASSAAIGFDDIGRYGGRFSPRTKVETISAGAGAQAVWKRLPGSVTAHDVRQDKGLFDSGQPSTSFDHFKVSLSAGSYGYYCTLHGRPGRGMAGTVKVKPKVKRITARRYAITWATRASASGNRYDVDWRVKGSKQWRHWQRSTKSLKATFGAGASPARVDPSKRYQMRVRSLDAAEEEPQERLVAVPPRSLDAGSSSSAARSRGRARRAGRGKAAGRSARQRRGSPAGSVSRACSWRRRPRPSGEPPSGGTRRSPRSAGRRSGPRS